MLISLNEIKKLVKIPEDVTTDDLVKLIGSRLVEVEGTIDLGEKYHGVYIIKVVSAEKLEGTHLSLCKVDAGPAGKRFAEDFLNNHPDADVTSNEDLVQVVCGAPNVHAGMFAVWIQPGAIVPSTFGGENFKLSVRKLQGYESYGMLAGADELGLDDKHEKIAEIDPKMRVVVKTISVTEATNTSVDSANACETRPIQPGDSFAEVFDLNDTILDIENKSLTHRPDCFGLIGFAREVAGILGQKFEEPSEDFGNLEISYANPSLENSFTSVNSLDISVKIADESLCPCYRAFAFELSDTELKDATESEKYLTEDAVFLSKAGMRSISKIVDATNIVMLKTGQPLHAFDYDKFISVGGGKKAEINVRAAKEGETLQLLDGKTIELVPSDIVICSKDIPVALAGAMGGESTEIDASTKRVILESATFSLYNERKMQMAHGIFSEAITRFTKGQPVAGTLPAGLLCAKRLLNDPSEIKAFVSAGDLEQSNKKISVTTSEINSLLGTSYAVDKIVNTLENVGFKVEETGAKVTQVNLASCETSADSISNKTSAHISSNNATLSVTTPAWRTDIAIKEDIIEEVGRLNGYDNIPINLPLRPFVSTEKNELFELKRELRNILSDRLGAHEVLTYSFVSRDLLKKVGEDESDAYEIVNSISPELQLFRESLTPSLLDKIHENEKAGFKKFSLFEMNQVSRKSYGLDDTDVLEITPVDFDKDGGKSAQKSAGVPTMKNHLSFVALGDFYEAKAVLFETVKRLGVKLCLAPFTEKSGANTTRTDDLSAPYFEPVRSAKIVAKIDGVETQIGSLGEIRRRVLKNFKVDETVSAFELDTDLLKSLPKDLKKDFKTSKFPSSERDLTLKVEKSVEYGSLEAKIVETLEKIPDLIFKVKPISIYIPKTENDAEKSTSTPSHKNISFRLRLASLNKTLESQEISDIIKRIEEEVKKLGVEIV